MRRTTVLLLSSLFIALVSSRNVSAQRFDHITIEDGLSESTVLAILQDSNGFLWFGTQNGLNKYDGSRMVVYRHDNADPNTLSGNDIGMLHESDPDVLWIGTRGAGLNRLDLTTESFTRYRHDPDDPTSISDDYINDIAQDTNGNLWIATRNNGFNRFDPRTETFERFTPESHAISHPRAEPVAVDRFGAVWVGTLDGLDRFDPRTGGFVRFHPEESLRQIHNPAVPALLVDSQDTVWVGTVAGVSLLSAETQSPLPLPDNFPDALRSAFIWEIFEDTNGDIWFATNGSGLIQFDRTNGTFHTLQHDPSDPFSLGSDSPLSLYEDDAGTLWIGTFTEGVSRIDPYRFKFSDQMPLDAFITAIEQTPDDQLWAGTLDAALLRLDHNGVAHRFTDEAVESAIYAIEPTGDGRLWIGAFNGVFIFEPTTTTFERVTGSEASAIARVLLQYRGDDPYGSADHSLWIGTSSGLAVLDPDLGTVTTIEALSSNGVYALHQDSDQQIWVGSQMGLHVIDPHTNAVTHISDLVVQGFVSVIHEDHAGDLWLGTWGDGLAHFDTTSRTLTSYGTLDGANVILGILQSDDDTLWLSTPNTLVRFDIPTQTTRSYDSSDGIATGGFVQAAYLQAASGSLLFGQGGGILAFTPETLRDNPHPPPVYLTDFQLFNESVTHDPALFGGQHISFVDSVTLTHDQSVFSFEFAALGFTNPAKNRYAYRMDGVDPDWNDVGNRNFVTYTNLDPGQYTFRVRAANSDGVWNEDALMVGLTILPPWWQTWWAYAGYVLLAVGLVVGIVQVRTREQRLALARERRLREVMAHAEQVRERDRARIGREMHDGLAQTLAALRFKMKVWNTLLQRSPEALPQQFDDAANLLEESIHDVRRSIYALRPITLEELGLIPAIEQFAALLRDQYKLQVHLSLSAQVPADLEHDLFRITQELMNNAARHAAADNLWVTATTGADQLQLTVRDDGIGFDPDKTTTDKRFGLTQLKERVTLRSGQHTIRSTNDKGTEITVLLPLAG